MGSLAFAYFRRTGAETDAERESRIATHAKERGIKVVATQTDLPTVSVTEKNANFSRLLVRMHAGEADTLIVDNLSCLSVDMIEQELVLSHLRRWGINVVCVADPELSATNPERRLLREFSDRTELSKRMEGLRLEGKRFAARKRTGKREGAKPYGEHTGEDVVLRQIRDLHQKGMGNTEISRHLNNQNIPPRRAKKWRPTTVANVLGARRNAADRKARRGTKKREG